MGAKEAWLAEFEWRVRAADRQAALRCNGMVGTFLFSKHLDQLIFEPSAFTNTPWSLSVACE